MTTAAAPAEVPKPSGTVVVMRGGSRQLELLLLERAPRDGEPGPWVFPGGKVDPADLHPGEDPVAAARRAAVRETREEAGLALELESLRPISRWITPEISPKRFDTWFFLAPLREAAEVRVDGGEIRSHRWLVPAQALALHRERGLRLAPPTFVTLCTLAAHASAEQALRAAVEPELRIFRPRIVRLEQGAVMLYPGDAGYEGSDAGCAGPRHRLWALAEGWRYELDLGAR
jgi:8-oxo-dGTP pyrophosphatase MutT (NUDIX family)